MSEPKPRVLVQEDAPQIARIIQFKLSMEGFDVRLTEEGEQTLASIRSEMPALIVLDEDCAGTNGWEVLRRLKEEGVDLPTLFLLENENKDRIQEAVGLGASDCLVKPFRPTQLAKKVSALLSASLKSPTVPNA